MSTKPLGSPDSQRCESAADVGPRATCPLPSTLGRTEALDLLERWHKPQAGQWLANRQRDGSLPFEGEPPACEGPRLWTLLLKLECDKLYNQAWCALEQIQGAEDPDDAMMLAIDDLPSAVEQAWSLAPDLAGEHLDLLRQQNPARVERFLQEMGAGTDREPAERAESLSFWEENAEITSDFRKRLYREVRAVLTPELPTRNPRTAS